MKNPLVTIVLVVAVALIIAGLFWYTPAQVVVDSPATTTPGVATTTPPAATTTPQTVTFRVIATGQNAANVSTRKNIAVYSQSEYANLWAMAEGQNGAARPAVDFSREYVIGVFAGQKSTGGHSIAVTSVIDTGTTRTLTVTLTEPGENCIVTQALTSPYQVIVVPLKDVTHANKNVTVSTPC